MRLVISILCFFVLVFLTPVELVWPFRRARTNIALVGPHPLELGANHYQSWTEGGAFLQLLPGFWEVGVDHDEKHVIGVMEESLNGYILCPFIAPRADLHYDDGRVKLRIHDVDATKIEPIFKNDTLNDIFFKTLGKQHIRIGEIRE